MPRPSHPPRLDHSNYTWRGVQFTKFLLMQCSPPTRHFVQISSSAPCSQTPLVHVSTLMSETRFHIRTEPQAKLSCLFPFLHFFTIDGKGEGFGPNGSKLPELNLLLLFSWIKFWFVTVVPKYLNGDTYSNNLVAIFMSRFWPAFWWRDSKHILSFLHIHFQTNSLLVSFKVSVFFFRVSMLSPNDHLCCLVVRVLGYRSRGPGSIPGTTRFSDK
jgi:hypothetical protein